MSGAAPGAFRYPSRVVYISKVYTRSGDDGGTMLASGDRVSKDAARVASYGEVDELNAVIGLVRVEIAREPQRESLAAVDEELARIQQELFDLGAELATPGAGDKEGQLTIPARHIDRLEAEIDARNEDLAPLKSFVLPGGGPVGATCHLARTVCRRAERRAVALARDETVRPEALRYLNRLSDYLFVLARAVAHQLGHDEVLWKPASS